MRVGLTGGIASGKSEVARMLASLGAFVVDTDALAREAVLPGSAALAQIARLWPQVVRDGTLDRSALAKIVFNDPRERERLNAIVHPEVRRLAAERERGAAPGQIIVQVVPLLFEAGVDAMMDATVVVVAPEDRRIARATARDGADADSVRARMRAQIDPGEARRRAAYVIENDGDLARLRERVGALYATLRGRQ